MPFVFDSSVALAWVLPDEINRDTDALCDRLTYDTALVPPIWPLEIGNVLLVAMRRGRIGQSESQQILAKLRALPISVDAISTEQGFDTTFHLAASYELTTYDAAYLELAQRRELPLATLDNRLRAACVSAGVSVLP
jgi:predicted nucleic acid-binding protein